MVKFLDHLNAVDNFHLVHLFHFAVDEMMAGVLQNLDELNLDAVPTFLDAVHLFQNLAHLQDVAVDAEFQILKMDCYLHVVQEGAVHRTDYFQDAVQELLAVVHWNLMAQMAQ